MPFLQRLTSVSKRLAAKTSLAGWSAVLLACVFALPAATQIRGSGPILPYLPVLDRGALDLEVISDDKAYVCYVSQLGNLSRLNLVEFDIATRTLGTPLVVRAPTDIDVDEVPTIRSCSMDLAADGTTMVLFFDEHVPEDGNRRVKAATVDLATMTNLDGRIDFSSSVIPTGEVPGITVQRLVDRYFVAFIDVADYFRVGIGESIEDLREGLLDARLMSVPTKGLNMCNPVHAPLESAVVTIEDPRARGELTEAVSLVIGQSYFSFGYEDCNTGHQRIRYYDDDTWDAEWKPTPQTAAVDRFDDRAVEHHARLFPQVFYNEATDESVELHLWPKVLGVYSRFMHVITELDYPANTERLNDFPAGGEPSFPSTVYSLLHEGTHWVVATRNPETSKLEVREFPAAYDHIDDVGLLPDPVATFDSTFCGTETPVSTDAIEMRTTPSGQIVAVHITCPGGEGVDNAIAVQVFGRPSVFSDGFESGDLAVWL